ncbi:unnamed protein product [Camellia sinensis]
MCEPRSSTLKKGYSPEIQIMDLPTNDAPVDGQPAATVVGTQSQPVVDAKATVPTPDDKPPVPSKAKKARAEATGRVKSKVARDVLALPVSTVASESAFSTRGRILDPFRSSLSPMMVEALICAQNWLESIVPISLRRSMDDVEQYEQYESGHMEAKRTLSQQLLVFVNMFLVFNFSLMVE